MIGAKVKWVDGEDKAREGVVVRMMPAKTPFIDVARELNQDPRDPRNFFNLTHAIFDGVNRLCEYSLYDRYVVKDAFGDHYAPIADTVIPIADGEPTVATRLIDIMECFAPETRIRRWFDQALKSRALWWVSGPGTFRAAVKPGRMDVENPTERPGAQLEWKRLRSSRYPRIGVVLPGGGSRESDTYLHFALPLLGQLDLWLTGSKAANRPKTRCWEVRWQGGADASLAVNLGGTTDFHENTFVPLNPSRWLFGPLRRTELSRVIEPEQVLPLPEQAYSCAVVTSKFRVVRQRLARFTWAGHTYHSGDVSFNGDPVDVGDDKRGAVYSRGTDASTIGEAIGQVVGYLLEERRRNGWAPPADAAYKATAMKVVDAVNADVPAKDPERAEWLAHQDHDLVAAAFRAVKSARWFAQATPLWAVVMDAFACGSQVAQALCRRFGEDPDQEMLGLIDAQGLCATCRVLHCGECEGYNRIPDGEYKRCPDCAEAG